MEFYQTVKTTKNGPLGNSMAVFCLKNGYGGGRNVSKSTTNLSRTQLAQDEFKVDVCVLHSKDGSFDVVLPLFDCWGCAL